MADRVIVNVSDGIADVRFNRPDKRNALDGEQFLAIAQAGERLKTMDGVRVVVLSGEGPSFCAGLDFSVFEVMAGGSMAGGSMDGGGSDGADRSQGNPGRITESGLTHLGQQVCWVWQELPMPVIAAVQGHALGGGLQIALGADIRIAHPSTQMSVREVHWGLVPDMTGTLMLSRLTRPDIAKELTFTARVFDAVEAHALGLVTRLSDDAYGDAMALAAEIAARSPQAVRGSKELFNLIDDDDVADQFAHERRVIGSLVGTPNQAEAIVANLEKRPPVFSD
jgi:enoyl-CoA hydratase/carnithine racemase